MSHGHCCTYSIGNEVVRGITASSRVAKQATRLAGYEDKALALVDPLAATTARGSHITRKKLFEHISTLFCKCAWEGHWPINHILLVHVARDGNCRFECGSTINYKLRLIISNYKLRLIIK